MLIRDAVPADLSAITAVYAHHVLTGAASFEEIPPDAAEMTRRFEALKAEEFPYLVAEIDGQVAGYAYAGHYRTRSAYRFAVEDSVYIDPAFHRRGVGKALMVELIARCTAMGKRQMLAVIGDSANAGSIGLHSHLGFVPVGTFRSVGFKFGRWVDSVLMQLALGDGDDTLPE